MNKYKLKVDSAIDVLESFQKVFNAYSVVTRECVKACNILVFNLDLVIKDATILRTIIFLLMNGFNTNDGYLRNYIHVVLMQLSQYSRETKFAINYALKDLDNPKLDDKYRDVALRSLFSILPETMYYDFEKYIQGNSSSGLVIAYEFFCRNNNKLKNGAKLNFNNIPSGTICDYHAAFLKKIQTINKYSGIIEVGRSISERHEETGGYLFVSSEPTLFVAACKALTLMKPEVAAPYVDKTVDVLRMYAATTGIEAFCAARYLSRLATCFARRVARANEELGELVRASQRCIAMIAIVTLLRTGTAETVARLGARLEPYMATMPDSYKRTAIDTMEGLLEKSGVSEVSAYKEYCDFLKRRLVGKCGLPFKRYILDKLRRQLNISSENGLKGQNGNTDKIYSSNGIVDFLCKYLEDPEFFEVSVDILGILGGVLEQPCDIVHVYNRLVLDNVHVQRAAVQALYDIGNNIEYVGKWTNEPETRHICKFLRGCVGTSDGDFSIKELGNGVHEKIIKYLPESYCSILGMNLGGLGAMDKGNGLDKSSISDAEKPTFIKECRKIYLNKETEDFYVGVIKRMFSDRVVVVVEIENRMQDVELCAGLLRFESSGRVFTYDVSADLFVNNVAVVEIELSVTEDDVVYGIFEYKVRFDEEMDKDYCSLDPFDFNVFDFIVPVAFEKAPVECKTICMKYACRSVEAATRVADIANMHMVTDRKTLVLSGRYNGEDVFVKVVISEVGEGVSVSMDIRCDNDDIIAKIVKVFE